MTTTITLSPSIKAALLQSVEVSIDMLNDMATEPMWMRPEEIRELATKSDTEIRRTISDNSRQVYEQIDQLVNLEILRQELNSN